MHAASRPPPSPRFGVHCCRITGYGMRWPDGVVLSWGGLRGAVGLVLALSVRNDPGQRRTRALRRAAGGAQPRPPCLLVPCPCVAALGSQEYRDLAFFLMALQAILTCFVQGSTMQPLLRVLGFLDLSPVEKVARPRCRTAIASAWPAPAMQRAPRTCSPRPPVPARLPGACPLLPAGCVPRGCRRGGALRRAGGGCAARQYKGRPLAGEPPAARRPTCHRQHWARGAPSAPPLLRILACASRTLPRPPARASLCHAGAAGAARLGARGCRHCAGHSGHG